MSEYLIELQKDLGWYWTVSTGLRLVGRGYTLTLRSARRRALRATRVDAAPIRKYTYDPSVDRDLVEQ